MNLEKDLKKIINSLSGNLLGIGINDKLNKYILKNNKISECNLIEINKKISKKSSGSNSNSSSIETIIVREINKGFRKKSIDYIICNYNPLKKEFHFLVKNSLFLCRKKIYIFGNLNSDDIDNITKKYERFKCKITINNNIIEIDLENIKYNKLKSYIYIISDSINNFIDMLSETIGNLLIR